MVKIARLEIENVKRVRAVRIEPGPTGLTIIGGRNKAGKTSVLDAIVWALGGNKYKPTQPVREGSVSSPRIRIELDNGLTVIRDGKNSSLKVVDQGGTKSGQALLDELIAELALDLPRFLQASGKEKAETLLRIIGVGDQLRALDGEIENVYNQRHILGQQLTRKRKHAEDLPFEQGTPNEEQSSSSLIQRQQTIMLRNAENQRLRAHRDQAERSYQSRHAEVERQRAHLVAAEKTLEEAAQEFLLASKATEYLIDESTEEIEQSLSQIDQTNKLVRVNQEKRRAEKEAFELAKQVDALTASLEDVRNRRVGLLANATLPLAGLSIEGGELTYDGHKWDCMASADQLKVGVAIVRKLRPDCKFVLMDKLEQMDLGTLGEFGQWLDGEGLQVIATRVSTGGECSIIIEDGLVAGPDTKGETR